MNGFKVLLAAVIVMGVASAGVPGVAAASEASLKIGGTGSALGGAQRLLDGLTKERPDLSGVVLPSVGTSGGIKAVAAGALDIGLSSRPLKPEERELGLVTRPYGITAVVFAVQRNNSRGNIRSTEIVDIYEEKITTWGDGTRIRFLLRPPSDGDTEILMRFLPRLEPAWKAAAERRIVPVAYTDQEAAEMIETIPGAFGPNSLSLIVAENRPIKVLALDGVSPTIDNIRNGTYDLTKTLYFVTRRDSGAAIQAFVDFTFSPAGRDILENIGVAPPKNGK